LQRSALQGFFAFGSQSWFWRDGTPHTACSTFQELLMSLVIRDPSPSEKRGNAMSAALAKEQLEYAIQIVQEVLPKSAGDGALIGAVMQAIAMNYAAVPQPNR